MSLRRRPLLVALTSLLACSGEHLGTIESRWTAALSSAAFAPTQVGTQSQLALKLTNHAVTPATLSLQIDGAFSVPASAQLLGGAELTLAVTFSPKELGTAQAVLHIEGEGERQNLALMGEGTLCPPHDACTRFDAECNPTPSPDGIACTAPCLTNGFCRAGSCAGDIASCDDGDVCTVDACDPTTGACVHPAITCPAATDPCRAALCDSKAGCSSAPAPDGTSCGPADCALSKICLAGTCVARPTPEGGACGDPSPCQGPGTCVNQTCVRPPATQLNAIWRAGGTLQFRGTVDANANVYFTEDSGFVSQPGTLVSLASDGTERWRAESFLPFPGAHVALVSEGRVVVAFSRENTTPNGFEVHDATTGAFLYSLFPDELAWTAHPSCMNLRVAYSTEAGPASDGAGTLYFIGGVFITRPCVNEPNTDETWLFAVDAATGTVKWSKVLFEPGVAAGTVTLVVDEQRRVFFSAFGGARAFDANGNELWSTYDWTLGAAYRGALVDRYANLYDAATGMPVATAPAPLHTVAVDEHQIWSLSAPAVQLERLDLTTGAVLLQAPVALPPPALSGSTFLTSRNSLLVVYENGGASRVAEVHDDGGVAFDCQLIDASSPERSALKSGLLFSGDLSVYELPGLDVAATGWVTQGGKVSRENRPR